MSGAIKSYNDLLTWQKAMDLFEEIYRIKRDFPKEELYGLTSQIRRAAVSIPSNIAEGHCRSRREFIHHLSIAQGSLSEVETQIEIAKRLRYITLEQKQASFELASQIGRMINGMMNSLEPHAAAI